MADLKNEKCKACDMLTLLSPEQISFFHEQITDWAVFNNKEIEKRFGFKNFKEALAFVNRVGEVAEKEQHHPDIFLYSWNKVKIKLSTHAIGGLSENDFIVASKIDELTK